MSQSKEQSAKFGGADVRALHLTAVAPPLKEGGGLLDTPRSYGPYHCTVGTLTPQCMSHIGKV